MSEDNNSKAIARRNLEELGIPSPVKKPEPEPEPMRPEYGGGYYSSSRREPAPDYVPAWLARERGATPTYGGSSPSPHKQHTSERTAQYAPSSYTREGAPFKVGERMQLQEAAVFGDAALRFVTSRVHEAMADALQRYGFIWTGQASLAAKEMIRRTMLDCTYRKEEQGSSSYVAVREEGKDNV